MFGSESISPLRQNNANNNHNNLRMLVELSDGFKDNIPSEFIHTVFKRNATNGTSLVVLEYMSTAAFDFVYHSFTSNNDKLVQIDYCNIPDILAASIEYNLADVWKSCYRCVQNMEHDILNDWILLLANICGKLDECNVDLSYSCGTPHTVRDLLTELIHLSDGTLIKFISDLSHSNEYNRAQNLHHLVKYDNNFWIVVARLSDNKWWWVLGSIWKTIIQCLPLRESEWYQTVYNQMDEMLEVKLRYPREYKKTNTANNKLVMVH